MIQTLDLFSNIRSELGRSSNGRSCGVMVEGVKMLGSSDQK